MLVGIPDMRPTVVDGSGALREGWGKVFVSLRVEGKRLDARRNVKQYWERSVAAVAVTECNFGDFVLTTRAFRAPVFPEGFDVLMASVRNVSREHA